MLAMRPDDSWNRLDITLDIAGVRWVSTRTTWLAQTRPMSAIFQPPTFDDQTLQAKVWAPLARAAPSVGGVADPILTASTTPSTTCTLRVIITPSSTPRAIWGKLIHNYQRAFYSVPFFKYVGNSLILVALTTIGAIFSSAFVAYAFARL